jgi:CheY-like chemotaxis protein
MWASDSAVRRWRRPSGRLMIRPMRGHCAAPTGLDAPLPTDVSSDASHGAAASNGASVRILVVDADRRVRAALSSLIGLAAGLELVASVGHVAAAMERLDSTAVDVLVVDPKLPDVDAGLGFVRVVRERWPRIGIVVLSWTDPRDANFELPADRYLPKTTNPAELIAALETFAGGDAERGRGPLGLR